MRFFHTILLLGAMLLCVTANAEIDISTLPYSIVSRQETSLGCLH